MALLERRYDKKGLISGPRSCEGNIDTCLRQIFAIKILLQDS